MIVRKTGGGIILFTDATDIGTYFIRPLEYVLNIL